MTPCLTGCLAFESRCKKCNRLLSEATVGPLWIDVKDKLPEVGEKVLSFNGSISTAIYDDKLGFDVNIDNNYVAFLREFEVTHWMPLPEPPKT